MESDLSRLDFTFQYPPFNVLNTHETGWPNISVRADAPMHIYLHVPYCRSKCQFCFYKVWGVGAGEKAGAETGAYLDLLLREIDLYAGLPEVQARSVRSLYIGGGTPSLLSARQIETLVAKLRSSFRFRSGYEFSFEAYPDEDILTEEKLDCLRHVGVNRLSIGVQSLHDRILELNGRPARTEQFLRLYSRARSFGFRTINLDFMSGMVGETAQSWKTQIDAILDLAPENVSFYKLEFYLNSRLTASLRSGKKKPDLIVSDSEEAAMAGYAFDRLQGEGGYLASNSTSLTRSRGVEQVHTKAIWNAEDLLGIGLSSYGIFDNYMYQNSSAPEPYAESVTQGRLPVSRAHRIIERESIARSMVNGVKVFRLSRREFADRHGFDMESQYGETIARLVAQGDLEFDERELRVPRNRYIFADDICRHFFLPEHQTMMSGQLLRSRLVKRSGAREAAMRA